MGLISEALKKIYFFAVDVFVWLITPALYVLCWVAWIFFWRDHEIYRGDKNPDVGKMR